MRAPTLLSISILAAATLSAQQAPPRANGVILGRVIDGSTGAPIPGALVTLARQSPASGFRVATDDEGGYVFTGLPPGMYSLTVTKPGYALGGLGQRRPGGGFLPLLELAQGQRMLDVKLAMWKHGSISGVVLDEAGEPVVGVSVGALRWVAYTGRRRLQSAGTALTDDRGMYRIPSLMPGDYATALTATQASAPASIYDRYWQDPGNTELRSAIFGALQVITPPGSPQTRQLGEVVLIGAAQGVVQPDPGAKGVLSIFPTTFHPAAMTPALAGIVTLAQGENKAGVDIRLSPVPTARVIGTLTGPDGPMSLSAVKLIPKWAEDLASESGFEAATTLTDGGGAFTFVGITPGAYVARATKGPRPGPVVPGAPIQPTLWAAEAVTVGNQDAGVRLTLRPGVSVTGRYEFDGTAPRPTPERLREIPLSIESIDARAFATPPLRLPQADNAFGIAGVPPGRYFIRIGGPPARWVLKSVTLEGRDMTETAVEIKDGDLTGVVITFTDHPTEINGRVRTAEGATDPDATVLIFPADPDGWVDFGVNPARLRSARVERSSQYALRVLPGDYYVIAVPEESTDGWWDPKRLEALSRRATRLRLNAGDTRVVDLTTVK